MCKYMLFPVWGCVATCFYADGNILVRCLLQAAVRIISSIVVQTATVGARKYCAVIIVTTFGHCNWH